MATFRVSNQYELNSAVKAVNGGDTVLLEPGTYSKLDISKTWNQSYDFGEKVTIASAYSSNPAVVREVFVRDASNIELKGLKLDYTGSQPDSPSYLQGRPFYIENASKITINDVTFDGHTSGGIGQGRGLRVKDSDQVVVKNSEFYNFHDGIDVLNTDDIIITANAFRAMGNDGMTLGGVEDVRIEWNDFRAFRAANPDENHKDAIQFRSGAAEGASSDIVIKGNTINIAEVVHGIWMGNELHQQGNWNNYYRNVLIEDNYIRSAHKHGITVSHGDDITIRDNTLVQNPDAGFTRAVNIPLINVSKFSLDVAIQENTVRSVQDPQNSSWSVWGNAVNASANLPHWDGDYPSWVVSPNPVPTSSASSGGGSSSGGGAGTVIGSVGGTYVDEELFRIDARRMDGDTRFTVERLDFSRDDELVLTMFDAGTFNSKGGGNAVWIWNNEGAVKIDSARDLQELVVYSSDITASTNGDELTLRIDRGSDVAEVVIENLGNEFRAAYQPELF